MGLTKRFQCACCGYYTLDHEPNDSFDICPVCYWEDDIYQVNHPDFSGGANHPSLNQARKNFKKHNTSDLRLTAYVRFPFLHEKYPETENSFKVLPGRNEIFMKTELDSEVQYCIWDLDEEWKIICDENVISMIETNGVVYTEAEAENYIEMLSKLQEEN